MSYRQLPGQASEPPDRMGAVEPVPEHVKGTVLPYRGTETHGVEPAHVDYDTGKYVIDPDDLGLPVDSLPAENEVEPIPVKVVNEFSRSRKTLRIRQVSVSNIQQLFGRNDARGRVWIRNLGANALYLVTDRVSDATALLNGYKIPAVANAGQEVGPIVTTEELYGSTGDGSTTTVGIIEEIEVEL